MDTQLAMQIRAKKLGILIRDARLVAGRTKRECAQALGSSTGIFNAYEQGRRAPSLPELEALAFFLDVPVEHFWGNRALSEAPVEESPSEKIARSLDVRQKVIGDQLHERRESADLSFAELSRRTGITTHRLKKYERGEMAIPTPELELLAGELDTTIKSFSNGQGPVAEWIREQRAFRKLLDLPEELQDFVCKPYNRPYLEIALRLSRMEVEKLRTVAEGLLDITL